MSSSQCYSNQEPGERDVGSFLCGSRWWWPARGSRKMRSSFNMKWGNNLIKMKLGNWKMNELGLGRQWTGQTVDWWRRGKERSRSFCSIFYFLLVQLVSYTLLLLYLLIADSFPSLLPSCSELENSRHRHPLVRYADCQLVISLIYLTASPSNLPICPSMIPSIYISIYKSPSSLVLTSFSVSSSLLYAFP